MSPAKPKSGRPGKARAPRGASGRPAEARSHTNAKLVSVIVPSFNRVRLLHELLESLRRQSWRPLEVIVIDDGSTDETIASLDSLWQDETDLSLHVRQQPNRGPASARNCGLQAATGEFLYFIDSDDLAEPDGIRKMVEALETHGAPYCVAQIRSVDGRGNALPFNDGNLSEIDFDSILGSHWAIHAALYRREVFDKAGIFNDELRTGEDSELRWRVVAANEPGILLDAVVGVFRRHGAGQVTDDNGPIEMGRSILQAVDKFCAWAQPRGLMTERMARRASTLLTVAAIRLGSGGDWEGKRRALALACTVGKGPYSVADRLLSAHLLESRLLFKGLEYGSRAARRALHIARSRSFARIAQGRSGAD